MKIEKAIPTRQSFKLIKHNNMEAFGHESLAETIKTAEQNVKQVFLDEIPHLDDFIRLFESPFTDLHDQGLMGVFDDAQAHGVVRIIETINEHANVG